MNLAAVATLARLKGSAATPGDYFALLWIFGVFLSRPFRQVPWIFTFTFDGWTSIKRIERFLMRHTNSLDELQTVFRDAAARKPDDHSASMGKRTIQKSPQGLEVSGLSLAIEGREILSDVTFKLEPGEFAAIVGEVGSGKSLLLMSLLGETAATAASLSVGETHLQNKSREERRAFFGFVPQDGFVMSATLRENIVFRYDVATECDAGVLEALRAAQFDPYAEGVVDGLAAEIGERGVNLSGGQRQRVGLARAAYLKRPVILLDDALSAVDVETERLLFDSLLFGAWAGTTRLMVTHRLSVLDRVDRILFLHDGRIHDQGTLSDLVSRNREFRAFIHSMGAEESSGPKQIAATEAETAVALAEVADTKPDLSEDPV
jgi:ABC-type multidrug transport system fused ATPase/permease subunit